MFDSCQQSTGNGPRCADVAEKLAQLFGWRQTYKVEKLQRTLSGNLHIRTHSVTKVPLGPRSSDPTLVTRKLLQRGTDSCGDTWVAVHNLQSQSGGGILDPDDKLNDVADDRETIIANFEDGDGVHHGGGDGASGSSVGTGSPDIFHGSDKYPPPYSRTDIEVTGEQIASGLSVPLQVRRGSEPALNQLIGCGPQPNGPLDPRPPIMQDPSKRWSAAPIILDDHLHDTEKNRNGHTNGYLSPEWTQEDDQNDDGSHFQRITRDGSNRLSMQFLGDGAGYRWAEAAERAAINGSSKNRLPGTTGSKSLPREHKRKEPLGQANTSASSSINFDLESTDVETIIIRNEPGQLGLHVVPDYDRMGKEKGLLVQGIEPGGRIDHDGKLAVYDRIIEINNQPLLNIPFQRVQEIFKNAQSAPELRLKVIKHRSGLDVFPNRPPPPVYPRPHDIARLFDDKENVGMVEVEEKLVTNTKVATVSPTKKIPSSSRNPKSLLTANTRKIGKKIELELVKGSHGLGFSITTRDNPAGGNCPIYIKNILPKGAAVEDGRLKPGDRLLEVNGIEMTGKTQAEAVTVLRNAPSGSCVRIVVSRQEDVVGPVLPRVNDQPDSLNKSRASSPSAPAIPPLPSSHEMSGKIRDNSDRTGSVAKIISQFQEAAKSGNSSPLDTKSADDSAVFPWKHREILTFNIPVHDSEKAGLGVSVKGKTTTSHSSMGSSDLGIFVKSVLHGGAASRDKRLRTNDQLLNVNGVSLLHQSNSDAMETLRRAMLHTEGPVPGSITLTIARRVPSPAPPHVNNSGRDSASSLLTNSSGPETFVGNSSGENESSQTTDNSGTSEKSGNTVIFLPYSKHSDTSGHSLNSSSHSNSHSFGNLDSWNPVIDRITGQTSNPIPSQLRNESYYRATHDQTWNGSFNQDLKLTSPTVNLPSGETILIENEYVTNYPSTPSYTTKDNPKVFKNSDVVRNTSDEKVSVTMVNSDQASDSNPVSSDATYASQLSLENPAGFSRDAFGRQSMSEKRHATLDAKNTDTYQRNKKLREEREKDKDKKSSGPGIIRVGSVESIISLNRSPGNNSEEADKLGQLGPSLGMKKSSSLESLQTMVQGIQMREDADPAYSYRGNQPGPKVIRGRGCDDSFRAAVDINYGKSIGNPNTTEESHAKKHWLLDPPSSTSNCDNDNIDVGFLNARGGLRQSSLNAGDIKNKTKKKPSLLKGIGSMFRFGKHRKTLDTVPSLDDHIITAHEINPISERVDVNIQLQSNETPHLSTVDNKQEQLAQNTQHQTIQLPHNGQHIHQHHLQHNPQSQYRPLMHQQQMKRMQNHNTNENASNSAAHIRSQHVQELRAMHQKRHAERHGQYISEEREDQYERAIRQRLEHSDPGHGRSASYEVYNDIQRPGSRQGISEPHRFSHYVNYDEIQHQLSRRQQHYHSQRQPQRENTQRPMSNFYEYESVQSFMHGPTRLALSAATQQHSSSNSENEVNAKALSRQTQFDKTASISKQHFIQHARPYQPPPPPVNDVYQQHNSNRQYQRYVSNHNQRNVHRHNGNTRGPFITQVTIEDQTQKSAGSRV